jgi:hypothetical protein
MLEATTHALRHPAYVERYQRNKRRLGRQRGAKVAQIDIARKLTEAIWHMLTSNQPFTPAREAPLVVWPPDGPRDKSEQRADTRRANLLAALFHGCSRLRPYAAHARSGRTAGARLTSHRRPDRMGEARARFRG